MRAGRSPSGLANDPGGTTPSRSRRRGLLRLAAVIVVLAAGAAAAVIIATAGSNPRNPVLRGAGTIPSTAATTVAASAAPRHRAGPPIAPAVRRLAASLTLDRQVAQLFLVGFTGTAPSAPFFSVLQSRGWGGAVLTADNFAGDPNQLSALAGEVSVVARNAGQVAPFVAAPQIGGTRTAFKGLPPPGEPGIGATGQPARAGRAAKGAGAALKPLGFNMVLAPDADVATAASPVADRSFSSDPAQVADFVRSAMAGWSAAGVIPVVGNFPGEGGASADPNVSQATVGGSLDQLRASSLIPFARIAARAPAIAVSSAIYAAFDGVTPAVLLPEAISLLRDDLGFGGVVVSGDLGATVQATGESIGATAVQALRAGCDLLYLQGNSNDEEAAYRAVLAAARSGALPRARIRSSVGRILALKARYGIIQP